MAKEKLDQRHYKEAFDRCLCLSKILQEVILLQPAIAQSEQATHLLKGAKSEIDAVAKLLLAEAKDNDGTMYDRAYWMYEVINELLVNHPVIIKDRQATTCVKATKDSLWALYQRLSDNYFTDEKPKRWAASKRVRK